MPLEDNYCKVCKRECKQDEPTFALIVVCPWGALQRKYHATCVNTEEGVDIATQAAGVDLFWNARAAVTKMMEGGTHEQHASTVPDGSAGGMRSPG